MRTPTDHFLRTFRAPARPFILFVGLSILLSMIARAHAQTDLGSALPARVDGSARADRRLQGSARVNPRTLALEFSLSLMTYPGRNGVDVPVDLNYSSKVWALEPGMRWWYPVNSGVRYVTDVHARFAERTAAGWSGGIQAPLLEIDTSLYDLDGRPVDIVMGDAALMDDLWDSAVAGASAGLMASESVLCVSYRHDYCPDCVTPDGAVGAHILTCNAWEIGGRTPEPTTLPDGTEQPPQNLFYIKRAFVTFPGTGRHEFRKDDSKVPCGTPADICVPETSGTYLSVDGTGMRLEITEQGSTLFLPGGSRYLFPSQPNEEGLLRSATEYRDINGNRLAFSSVSGQAGSVRKLSDTMERTITDPLPRNHFAQFQTAGRQETPLPWFGGTSKNFTLVWENLKPIGCEESADPQCEGAGGVRGGALADQAEKLFYDSRYFCAGSATEDLLADRFDPSSPLNEVLFPGTKSGIRPCSAFRPGQAGGPHTAVRFNPVVLSEVILPDGNGYRFEYNRYGEISRIRYPSGVYEEFEHERVAPLDGLGDEVFDQSNRGVVERRIYDHKGAIQQRWKYTATFETGAEGASVYRTVSTVSQADNVDEDGARTETVFLAASGEHPFGFGSAKAGSPQEILEYDASGNLISRTLFESVSSGPIGGGEPSADRDARNLRTVEVRFEPGGEFALAKMRMFGFDSNGSPDPSHFSHLNAVREEVWGYAPLDAGVAATAPLPELAGLVQNGSRRSSVQEREFLYDSGYREAGVSSLLAAERLLDPANSAIVLNEIRYEYDSSSEPLIDPGTPPGWVDPGHGLRANVTAVRRLDALSGDWLSETSRYDKFGNVRITRDASGNELRYTEVAFSKAFHYAYPTATTRPAPDPAGKTGSARRSGSKKEYDLTTGLVLSVRDILDPLSALDDRITRFEYSDPLLRPTAVTEPGGARKETSYSQAPGVLTVTVRNQVDAGVWQVSDETLDGFGRTVKTRDFRSGGVSVVLREYDLHGRLVSETYPFYESENNPQTAAVFYRYDPAGRPAEIGHRDPGGTESIRTVFVYGLSSAPDAAGTVKTVRDGSGRETRTVADHLGRVVRTDEPAETGSAAGSLGTVGSPLRPTFYRYGARGRLIEIRQGVQRRFFLYDSFGRIIRQKLPEQEANPDLSFPDPETGNAEWSSAFEHDRAGNSVGHTSANGVVTETTYDLADRPTLKTYSDGTPSESFKYDLVENGHGQLIEASSGSTVTRALGFDLAGNITAGEQVTDGISYVTRFGYTLSGEEKYVTYPSGRTVSTIAGPHGETERIEGRSKAGVRTYADAFTFAPGGKTETMRLGNGIWESALYDSEARLSSIAAGTSPGGRGIWSARYEYGEINLKGSPDPGKTNGSVSRITIESDSWPDAFVQTFKYDGAKRLAEAKESKGRSSGWNQRFTYDRYGNRVAMQQTVGAVTETMTVEHDPETNRPAPDSGYLFDRNGNVIDDPEGRTYVFDAGNRQTEIRDAGGVLIASYFYDAEGRRVKTVTTSETTVFVYAGDRLIAEYSTSPPSDPQLRYLTVDHLGTTRLVTGALGEVLERRDFKPFGEELFAGVTGRSASDGYASLTSKVRQGFAGYKEDTESGLNYAEARMYDPAAGRFTAIDPLLSSSEPGDPRTLNRYTYAMNDPVNVTDPSGLAAVDDWYVSDGGKIEVHRTSDPFDRFYVFDENRKIFSLVAQLEKNSHGLVRFPDKGYGFTNYNPGERGGYDPQTGELVGVGDHYLRPVTAAALFGFTNQLKNDHGITLALGDMSASNGSDPWDIRFRSAFWNGHHSSHGHLGNGTGLSIDFRYVGLDGKSRQGNWADDPQQFSKGKNQAVFDLARKWGFTKSLKGVNVPIRHARAAKGHNDHGHLGFDLRRKRIRTLGSDRRRFFMRRSEWTIGCSVDVCR